MEATEAKGAGVPAADLFARRHIGSGAADRQAMLEALGKPSLDALIDAVVPPAIRLKKPLDLPAALSEAEALSELKKIASKNAVLP